MPSSVGVICPDEDVVAQFVGGELSPHQRAQVEAHVDACPQCGEVVAGLVRIFFSRPSAGGPRSSRPSSSAPELSGEGMAESEQVTFPGERLGEADKLEAGQTVGRYKLLECVGAGAMGVVYAAYDPELDRRVALKLLRSGEGSDGPGRLQREAQAMARLAHPNVITVHDVGTRPRSGGGPPQVFIAMEFVQGCTMAAWMHKRRRRWSELRAVFVAAGRGLAAAHAAGLVHRDFKPDNVLIGDDGRVRVTDFGLARFGEAPSEAGSNAALGPQHCLAHTLTETGALVGTPAYMAPEQYKGRAADALSDQYSFCVALYEALYRVRPVSASNVGELASRVVSGEITVPPRDAAVPRFVRQAVLTGLALKPSNRFPSMPALLAVLDRGGRSWARWAAALVPALGLSIGLLAYAQEDAGLVDGCRENALAGVWDDAKRRQVREVFAASEVAFAADAFAAVDAGLTEYADGWLALNDRVCEEEPQRRRLAPLRRLCLERRRLDLVALVGVLAKADGDVVRRSPRIPEALPRLEACQDEAALTERVPQPPPPALAMEVARVRTRLAEVRALMFAGKLEEARERVEAVIPDAEGLDYAPLHAEASYNYGAILDRLGEIKPAQDALYESLWRATASRYRDLAARALVELIYVVGYERGDQEAAQRLDSQLRAELEAMGGSPTAEAARLMNMGAVAMRGGDRHKGLALQEQALAIREELGQELRRADALYNVATAQFALGNYAKAHVMFRECLRVYEERLPEVHPDIADVHQSVGLVHFFLDNSPDARKELELALDLWRRSGADKSMSYVDGLNALGSVLNDLKQHELALEQYERAFAIRSEALGSQDAAMVHAHVKLATGYHYVRRFEESEREVEAALRLGELAGLTDLDGELGDAYGVRALNLLDLDRLDEAADAARRALASAEATIYHRHNFGFRLAILGRILFELGEYAEAETLLRRTLAVADEPQVRAAYGPYARFLLAQIIARRPGECTAAIEQARRAESELRDLDDERYEAAAAWIERATETRCSR